MGNHGTILNTNGHTGRQPWSPASYYNGNNKFTLAVTGVDYYGETENLPDSRIQQGSVGFGFFPGKFRLKTAYLNFNAMNLYQEHEGLFSAGMKIFRHLSAGFEINGFYAAVPLEKDNTETLLTGGFSAIVPWQYASTTLRIDNINLISAAKQGFDLPLRLQFGIHTNFNRLGSQGIIFEILNHYNTPEFRFHIGEDYHFSDYFSISTALSTNPIFISFGFTFHIPLSARRGRAGGEVSSPHSAISAAFVHHPVLGLSKGITMDYSK